MTVVAAMVWAMPSTIAFTLEQALHKALPAQIAANDLGGKAIGKALNCMMKRRLSPIHVPRSVPWWRIACSFAPGVTTAISVRSV
jgi:hypothetical protein